MWGQSLVAAGVTPFATCIDVCYDTTGLMYEIPNYCINQPFIVKLQKIVKEEEHEVNLKIRMGAIEEDLTVRNSIELKELKEKLNCKRLFYKGKELVDGHQIREYKLGNEAVVIGLR